MELILRKFPDAPLVLLAVFLMRWRHSGLVLRQSCVRGMWEGWNSGNVVVVGRSCCEWLRAGHASFDNYRTSSCIRRSPLAPACARGRGVGRPCSRARFCVAVYALYVHAHPVSLHTRPYLGACPGRGTCVDACMSVHRVVVEFLWSGDQDGCLGTSAACVGSGWCVDCTSLALCIRLTVVRASPGVCVGLGSWCGRGCCTSVCRAGAATSAARWSTSKIRRRGDGIAHGAGHAGARRGLWSWRRGTLRVATSCGTFLPTPPCACYRAISSRGGLCGSST